MAAEIGGIIALTVFNKSVWNIYLEKGKYFLLFNCQLPCPDWRYFAPGLEGGEPGDQEHRAAPGTASTVELSTLPGSEKGFSFVLVERAFTIKNILY